jgi:AcrR family transcriptional regulator
VIASSRDRKREIRDAAIRLVAGDGLEAATTRAIARAVGVTEAALYRHYGSKEEILWGAYRHLVEELLDEKQHLLEDDRPLRARLREWVRLTYAYYDRNPAAFTYALLIPDVAPREDPVTQAQGRLFMAIYRDARKKGEVRPLSPKLALSHFTGVLLNVPRLINEGVLPPPASRHVDEVANAVWRLLGPAPSRDDADPARDR